MGTRDKADPGLSPVTATPNWPWAESTSGPLPDLPVGPETSCCCRCIVASPHIEARIPEDLSCFYLVSVELEYNITISHLTMDQPSVHMYMESTQSSDSYCFH